MKQEKRFFQPIALLLAAALLATGFASAEAVSATETTAAETTAETAVETEATAEEADDGTIRYPDTSIKENLPVEAPSAAEDFYLSVNYDYIKDTEIPVGSSEQWIGTTIKDVITKEMEALLGSDTAGGWKQQTLSTLYKMLLDTDSRNAAGWDSVRPYVEAVEQAQTVEDLLKVFDANAGSWKLYSILDVITIANDQDSTTYIFDVGTPNLSLMDPAEYEEMTAFGEMQKEMNDEYYTNLLKKYGYSDEETTAVIDGLYAWETQIAAIQNAETAEELTSEYNHYTEDELIDLAGSFPMKDLLVNLGVDGQSDYLVDDPILLKAFGDLMTEENLENLKSYAILNVLTYAATYTDEEALGYYTDYSNEQTGAIGTMSAEDTAYMYMTLELNELVGDVYAENFYDDSEEAKVLEMVDNIRAAVRARLEAADWLSDETRQMALDKFDAITIYVGCAKEDFYDYSNISPDTGKDLFTNMLAVHSELFTQRVQMAGQPVNKEAWGFRSPANVVNGSYDPQTNSVHIQAAILQAPFYSSSNSDEQNYGALGYVIGHELTHAFDSTGSQYDKDGNCVNWWTEEDTARFEELTQAVEDRYAAYETVEGYHVDGQLTRNETVADLGGMAAAIDAIKALKQENIDFAEFFTQNAKVWACVHTEDTAILNLRSNPHAPYCLRINVNLAQFEEFQEAFGIKEGDAMYTAPENRLKVW